MRVGSCVTDLMRKHPRRWRPQLLTLDHLTRGKAILGLGSGEQMNITPYGMAFERPVGKLSEGIDVMRLLWPRTGRSTTRASIHRMKDAVLGLSPYGERPPEIWLAAHGPRMLRLTGRQGRRLAPDEDAPDDYAGGAGRASARRRQGRRPRHRRTSRPGMLAYVAARPRRGGPRAAHQRPAGADAVRHAAARVRRSSASSRRSAAGGWIGLPRLHPDARRRARSPTRIVAASRPRSCATTRSAARPSRSPRRSASSTRAGLRHLICWNITGLGDPSPGQVQLPGDGQIKNMLRAA